MDKRFKHKQYEAILYRVANNSFSWDKTIDIPSILKYYASKGIDRDAQNKIIQNLSDENLINDNQVDLIKIRELCQGEKCSIDYSILNESIKNTYKDFEKAINILDCDFMWMEGDSTFYEREFVAKVNENILTCSKANKTQTACFVEHPLFYKYNRTNCELFDLKSKYQNKELNKSNKYFFVPDSIYTNNINDYPVTKQIAEFKFNEDDKNKTLKIIDLIKLVIYLHEHRFVNRGYFVICERPSGENKIQNLKKIEIDHKKLTAILNDAKELEKFLKENNKDTIICIGRKEQKAVHQNEKALYLIERIEYFQNKIESLLQEYKKSLNYLQQNKIDFEVLTLIMKSKSPLLNKEASSYEILISKIYEDKFKDIEIDLSEEYDEKVFDSIASKVKDIYKNQSSNSTIINLIIKRLYTLFMLIDVIYDSNYSSIIRTEENKDSYNEDLNSIKAAYSELTDIQKEKLEKCIASWFYIWKGNKEIDNLKEINNVLSNVWRNNTLLLYYIRTCFRLKYFKLETENFKEIDSIILKDNINKDDICSNRSLLDQKDLYLKIIDIDKLEEDSKDNKIDEILERLYKQMFKMYPFKDYNGMKSTSDFVISNQDEYIDCLSKIIDEINGLLEKWDLYSAFVSNYINK